MSQRRKGGSVAQRDAEEFLFKKNQHKSKQTKLKDKLFQPTAETIFGARFLISPVKPPLKFTISVKYVAELSRSLIETYYSACRIEIMPQDLITLTLVSIMQVESKVWFARQSSPFAMINEEIGDRAQRVEVVLPDALFPISYYIDQIGCVVHENQMLIPEIQDLTYENFLDYAENLGFSLLPPGIIPLRKDNVLTGTRQWVKILNQNQLIADGVIQIIDDRITFTDDFLLHPNNYPWVGHMRIEPWHDVLPTFDEIANAFHALIGRVSFLISEPKSAIDFTNARGTLAQLVTSRDIDLTGRVKVWSNRFIDADSLMVGALLRFGYGLVDKWHSHDFCCCEAFVEIAGSTEQFIRNVMNKLH